MKDAGQESLKKLAEAAGLQVKWQDAHGKAQTVQADTLRTVLQALDIPCATPEQCRESLARLSSEAEPRHAAAPVSGRKNMTIVQEGASVVLPRSGSAHYRLQLEGGKSIMGTARDLGNGFVAIPGISSPGYHQLEMGGIHCTVAVTPRRCPSIPSLLARNGARPMPGASPWVLGAQVYGLCRDSTDTGTKGSYGASTALPGWETGGDFSLVGALAREAAAAGACGLAISPVHAMFSSDLGHYSPYSPSSRLFLNAGYADPGAVFDADFLSPLYDEPRRQLLDASGCLDWPAVQALRLRQLRSLFDRFESRQPETPLRDFEIFKGEAGEALENHATFEALHAHFSDTLGPGHGWRDWPGSYHDPAGESVRQYRTRHASDVRFHAFLQWLAARSLRSAHETARSCMPLGLIADMAVGTDPRGSHAWSRQDQIMTALSVGAPPDIFQPQGQNWGLTAFSPHALRLNGYEAFIETLRASLAYAGGVRVDHVMGLARMWLVPEGASAADGVYLSYPREDMLDLLALESWRHSAVVVGENLGTVPGDFNKALYGRGMLGMSVLWFEQEGSGQPVFKAPDDWPAESMAMASTHDLPTLRGWWLGRDIEWRVRQGEFDDAESSRQREEREQQKSALWRALQNCDLVASDASVPAEAPAREILAFLAKTPSALLSVALEDLLGHEEQPNLPGECPAENPEDRHPNWRRRYALPVQGALQSEATRRLLSALRTGDPA